MNKNKNKCFSIDHFCQYTINQSLFCVDNSITRKKELFFGIPMSTIEKSSGKMF